MLEVYSYFPIMKWHYAKAWIAGRKNRSEMMSSSKSFLPHSFSLMPRSSCDSSALLVMKCQDLLSQLMQFLWPYCFFTMVIVLNQFINPAVPSDILPWRSSPGHSINSLWFTKIEKKARPCGAINFKWLSKHASAALTASLLTLDLCARRQDHPNQPHRCWSR